MFFLFPKIKSKNKEWRLNYVPETDPKSDLLSEGKLRELMDMGRGSSGLVQRKNGQPARLCTSKYDRNDEERRPKLVSPQ